MLLWRQTGLNFNPRLDMLASRHLLQLRVRVSDTSAGAPRSDSRLAPRRGFDIVSRSDNHRGWTSKSVFGLGRTSTR